MKPEPLEVIHGSGNLYRDFGYSDADSLLLRDVLAAEIIKTLDRKKLTVRQAQERTGIAAADFSRIRNCDLKRFTLDRLMGIINKLGSRVEISMEFKPDAEYAAAARATGVAGGRVESVALQSGKRSKGRTVNAGCPAGEPR